MRRYFLLCSFTLFISCAHLTSPDQLKLNGSLSVFLYDSNLLTAANDGETGLKNAFEDYFRHIGRRGPGGDVGIALVFPYLSWTEGKGRGPYTIPERLRLKEEAIIAEASKLNVPVLVQFNGAVWHSPSADSAFIQYWKTVDGGKYLSRYKDGRVNSALNELGFISKKRLQEYATVEPYAGAAQNSLFFTLSPYAQEFRSARLEALRNATRFWKEIDAKYPGVIRSFTTDSEVSNLSFRFNPSDPEKEIPIGYESWNTEPFCKLNRVLDCAAFFSKEFRYQDPLERKWQEFRAKNHRDFVQDTVNVLRESFRTTPIFTHQIAVLDEDAYIGKNKRQDLASPQSTAFVQGANAGFTVYTYAGDRYGTKRQFVEEVHARAAGKPWGFLEFNTAEGFKGTKKDLASFTKEFVEFAEANGVRIIAPLSWQSNSLDHGIKDNGVDSGIRQAIEGGR